MKALGQGSIASWIKRGLSVAAVVLWIALGIVGLIAVAALIAGVAVALGAPFSLDGDLWVEAPGVTFSGRGLGLVSWPFLAAVILSAAVFLGGALVIVDRLSRLFQNFISNEPFNKANADHLRAIWIVMLGMELARYAFALAVGWSVAAFGRPEGVSQVRIEPGIDVSTWASILVLIVLAEVFREGARMREDQDLTI